MDELGLIPSDTGRPGGKRTGQKCSHYIEPKGPFAVICTELLKTGLEMAWRSVPGFASG